MSDTSNENVSRSGSNGERPSFLHARDPSIDRRFRPRPDRQVRLFDEIKEECNDKDEDSSSLDEQLTRTSASYDSAASTEEEHAAMVFLRLRPVRLPSTAYTISDTGNVLIAGPSNESTATSNKNNMERHYSFSAIFDGEVAQSEVYKMCVAQKINNEDSFTVLTYGTSGSGKTFTLLGDNERPGIVPRALEHLFTMYQANIYPHPALKLVNAHVKILDDVELAKEQTLCSQVLGACEDAQSEHVCLQQVIQQEHNFELLLQENMSVFIWISFVEIYNELVYDLLAPLHATVPPTMAPPTRKNLKLVCNDGKVFIKGLTMVHAKNSMEALKLLKNGLQHVSYASTAVNANSSRSHCIFFVDVLKYQSSGVVDEISYKFCDLAGSERLEKTRNVGDRLTEAKGINTSLMVLGRCLDAINSSRKAKVNKLIPYRESKLTMLLQAALLGKEKLSMVVNVTPTDAFYEENMNVLRFSSIAKNIIFKQPVLKQNKSRYSFLFDQSKVVGDNREEFNQKMQQLLQENIYLRSEINRLNEELQYRLLKQEQELRNKLVDSFEVTLEQRKKQYEKLLQEENNMQKRMYEAKIAALKRRYESEIQELREEYEGLSTKRRTID